MDPNARSRPGIADRARLGCVLLLALISAAGTLSAQPAPLDDEIAFLEARLSRDEADPITPTRLGHAYLRKARATRDFTLYQRAESVFRQALERSPEYFGALTGLAGALSARHAFRDALAVAERAVAAGPDSPDGYAAAGDAALEAGLLDKAAAMYARVEALAPGYHTDTRRANLAAARGDTRGAYAALERAAADAEDRGMTPDLIAWCHLRAGGIAWEHGDWPRAERSYAAARALTPASPVVLEHLAELRAAQGRDEEALELYGKAQVLSPQPEFHEAAGAIQRRRGRAAQADRLFGLARAGYEKAAHGGDPGAYRPLALFLLEVEGRPADALTWARKDAGIRQDAVTLGILAWVLLKNGLEEESGRVADTAIQARPVDADTWYRAGVVSMTRGDRAAARTRLTRALAINPRFRAAADAARLLKRVANAEVNSAGTEGKIAVDAGKAIAPFDSDPAQQRH